MSERALLGPSAIMAVGTVTSRVTGVMRDIAMTAALGFFLVSDAFSLGNSLPNMIYILILGGALNAVFIPQLVRKMKEDADDGRAYADRLITLTAIVLLTLAIVSIIFAPQIVDLYTPSDYPQNEFDLALAFTRLCLPQIFFYGIYTMFSQVLNTRGKFGAPMFAPIANNIVAITAFLLFIYFAGTGAAADGNLNPRKSKFVRIQIETVSKVHQSKVVVSCLISSAYKSLRVGGSSRLPASKGRKVLSRTAQTAVAANRRSRLALTASVQLARRFFLSNLRETASILPSKADRHRKRPWRTSYRSTPTTSVS